MFCDEFAQPQAFIQLSHEQQATIRRYSRSLEIHLQRGVERELKGLVLLFTHWVQASGVSLRRQSRMNTGVGAIIQPLTQSSKRKYGVKHMAADPQVHSALVSLLSNSSEFPAAYNVLEPLIAAPTWLIDWRRGWKLRPTTGACLQNANR